MPLEVVIVFLGFIGLIWGADKFVFGASALARNLGVSPLMIGLTIVAFGTSAPEIFSSAASVVENQPELAIGNALGSNIFNIGFVLGITSIIKPLPVNAMVLSTDIYWLLGVSLLLLLMVFLPRKLLLSRWKGMLMLSMYLIYLYVVL